MIKVFKGFITDGALNRKHEMFLNVDNVIFINSSISLNRKHEMFLNLPATAYKKKGYLLNRKHEMFLNC